MQKVLDYSEDALRVTFTDGKCVVLIRSPRRCHCILGGITGSVIAQNPLNGYTTLPRLQYSVPIEVQGGRIVFKKSFEDFSLDFYRDGSLVHLPDTRSPLSYLIFHEGY